MFNTTINIYLLYVLVNLAYCVGGCAMPDLVSGYSDELLDHNFKELSGLAYCVPNNLQITLYSTIF